MANPKSTRKPKSVANDRDQAVLDEIKAEGCATMSCGKAVSSPAEYLKHINTCKWCIKRRQPDASAAKSEPVQLELELFPALPGHMRAIPTTIARSALFRVADKRAARQYIDPKRPLTVAALKGITITYHGPELRQDQATVMLQLHQMCRTDPVAAATDGIRFVPHQVLSALKMGAKGPNYKWLKLQLDYLSDGAVEVKTANEGWSGKLVRKFAWRDNPRSKDPMKREYRLWLEPEMIRLFAQWTGIDFEQRLALHSSLAQAIHSHLSTHDEPHPFSVAKWRELTGSETKALRRFRQALKRVLQELVEIKFLSAWRIDDSDLVHVALRDRRQLDIAESFPQPTD